MFKRSLAFACVASFILLFSGCATPAPRTIALHSVPTKLGAQNPIEAASVSVALTDHREDRTIDPILAAPVADTVNAAIRQALTDSKLIRTGGDKSPALEIKGELTRLQWVVPGYQAMLKKVFVTSFLTGGLGGLAYGSTDTPVEGHVLLSITVTRGGQEVFKRDYTGLHEEKLIKLKCDTLETKSRVTGLALANAVDKLIADLDAAKL